MFKRTISTLTLLLAISSGALAQQAKPEVECREGRKPHYTYTVKKVSPTSYLSYLEKIECQTSPTAHTAIGVPGKPSFETRDDMVHFLFMGPEFFKEKDLTTNKKP